MPTCDVENAVLDAHLESWMESHPGAHVAIRGQEVLGFHPTGLDAYMATVNPLGGEVPFLIRRVEREGEPGPLPHVTIEVVR